MGKDGTRDDGTLLVNRIQRFCLHDGPGIRTTVFTQGCNLSCWWCHNPQSRASHDPEARPWPVGALVDECAKDARYWRASRGGLTVSGGECLLQPGPLRLLLAEIGLQGYHRCVDTAGAVPHEALLAVAEVVDLWLWDFKAASPDRFGEQTGGDWQLWRTNLMWVLEGSSTPLVLRVPLVNGLNCDADELHRMADLVAALPRRVPVELLPGHAVGSDIPCGCPSPCVSREAVEEAQGILRSRCEEVTVLW